MVTVYSRRLSVGCLLAASSIALTGCAPSKNHAQDPHECWNRGVYLINHHIDKIALRPAARLYDALMPTPVQFMVSNFFQNVNELPILANNFLQGKFRYAAHDTTRFIINTTIGMGGLFDVATKMNIPRHPTDFGLTLARWGYKNSNYLVLPLFGPSTWRDGVGRVGDYFASPWPYIHSVKARNEFAVTYFIDTRKNLLKSEKVLDAAAVDEYDFMRDAYLQRREYLIKNEEDANNAPGVEANALSLSIEAEEGPPA